MNHSTPGLPVPSPTPGVYSNSCPLSWWCHSAISSSVVPFSSCPQSLPASGSFPVSQLRMGWPKYWSFSFSISPSNEHPGLISFRMGWLDLLAVQGTLKSLIQDNSSKASIFWHSAFFTVQLTSMHDSPSLISSNSQLHSQVSSQRNISHIWTKMSKKKKKTIMQCFFLEIRMKTKS